MKAKTRPRRPLSWTPVLALIAMVGAVAPAAAELRIDITRGTVEPLPIAITDFLGTTPEDARFGRDISGVVSADLVRSGLFHSIDRQAFIQTAESKMR